MALLIFAYLLLAIAATIAVGNAAGGVIACARHRRGDTRGFSCVPILSLAFCIAAWIVARDKIGLWALVPALLDPATWSMVMLPFFLLRQHVRRTG